jgi:hypothetical protein
MIGQRHVQSQQVGLSKSICDQDFAVKKGYAASMNVKGCQ